MSAVSVEDHISRVRGLLQPMVDRPAESVSVADALGRVALVDVASPVDLPLFRNSQMDGYAVRSAEVAAVPVTLRVVGTVAAGDAHTDLVEPGTVLKIMTGAPVPEGADAIVPVENTIADGDHVTIDTSREPGEYIREQGSDVRAGMLLVRAGQVLEPRHIAVLAAVGLSHIDVRSRPRVAVITTGAELVDAGTELRPGQIYDSNGITLAAHLAANGADVVAVLRSSDEPETFRRVLSEAVAAAELVITSGGVSKGDFEVVKDVLAPMGGVFGSVRMQPGGPQGTAVVDGVPVLNFPGNPVSTVVSFVVFARDIVREAAGLEPLPTRPVPLKTAIDSIPGKRQFLRGAVQDGHVSLIAGPGSHLVAAMAWADVLVDVGADITSLDAGTDVPVVTL
ncbi:molybdopterin molybdotransferase MoeA [Rhodococcoides kyotonense]|uniref:molybdopterin molybdotransferase MoeA n=1 Tax=Rhodococcoides kyotonense TaxID=398843 RepID=UPI000B7881C5|nr:gephyrin-like molybdotransferase Glp [Rhodococcus kyotonensis]